jgi:hypothetical protein
MLKLQVNDIYVDINYTCPTGRQFYDVLINYLIDNSPFNNFECTVQ